MDATRLGRIEEVFEAVTQLASSERRYYLDEACGDDEDLRAEVESLLAAAQGVGGFMEQPAVVCTGGDDTAPQTRLAVGGQIGAYTIVRVIATGGMGTVYQAVQDRPQRDVALKVMRASLTSGMSLRRFEYESEVLGRLSHPSIARVYEAGTWDDGGVRVPYFAMEYVPEALPITQYAKERGLSTVERLELFTAVCDAVHHGHQRGIIHRDLKPDNILVEASGQPKIIDFGVARATDSDVTVTTMHTDIGQLVGTLQYMSPEQFDADSRALDIRCDVYTLGLVLYELLCGQLPYDISKSSISETARIVKEVAPRRLSSVSRVLRGDVETIADKALEKDKDRRYQSAAEIAQDIRRYLSHEPIQARPPTLSYQVRMFMRRNKPVAAALLTMVTVLIAATITSSVFAYRAHLAAAAESVQRIEAHEAATRARAINDFLLHMLTYADPRSADHDVTIREALDQAAARIEAELSDQPDVYAAVCTIMGGIYSRLDRFAEAEQLLRTAIDTLRDVRGEDDLDLAGVMADLAWMLGTTARAEEAEELASRSLEIQRRLRGEDHPQTALAMVCLAHARRSQAAYKDAERLQRTALAVLQRAYAGEHENVAFAMSNLALTLRRQERFAEAEALFHQAIEMQRRTFGDDHMEVAIALNNLAGMLEDLGRMDEAATLRDEANRINNRRFGRAP